MKRGLDARGVNYLYDDCGHSWFLTRCGARQALGGKEDG